ncbi:protein phosphatase regulatory subunit Gac1, putative [Talaromyces stipitatus ATCC 10500]|uniref:Protein phosphatase regulatory subunit Gac1, putative n=1 Tax=Talaromyces stipitatus (strain ATCC 10500 / CBS 375.48 / QM 6759 / NRRL 1006) TaxID=441959 RepID=B8MIW4_TALSN|nr:protein phosphatase regulatory subunit Gac1, putative [Talaromyces stipitatus ATCC 10500]EED15626.1 protein phosphatase regulatory subunit Gac1, putative [Talaromyces stipitatus ATCC 10500]
MPYTSPLQMSPTAPLPPHLTQTPVTPVTAEAMHTHSSPSETAPASSSHFLSHAHPRSTLPRSSFSSQSYLRRHRRSPSYSKVSLPNAENTSTDRTSLSMTVDPHASLRQSPPPRNNAIIPSGAVISPPESTGNSSDEEASPTDVRHVDLIDAAIRTLNAQKKNEGLEQEKKEVSSVPALTPEARKISHSRSSTEGSLPLITDMIETSSESDRDEDGDEGPKPPMVRKKSGELVRPALRSRRRPSSMPGTPTFSKNVHFDAQLEHIRHFLQLDKPLAVSANTSPVETYNEEHEYPFNRKSQPSVEWEIKLPNFPSNPAARKQQPIRLERVFFSPDHKNLVGVVSVANLAFQKHVVARFTVDYWKTVSEVTAEYNHDIRKRQAHDGYDRFDFSIKLSDITDLESKVLQVCIRYSVNGQEYWDNNDNMNYQIQFVKSEKTLNNESAQQAQPRDRARALPRSRHSPSTTARPRSMPPASFDDFGPSFDGSDRHDDGLGFRLSTVDSYDFLEAPKPREKPNRQAFGNRYDFGLSLSAARSSGATEDRTTLSAKAKSMSSRGESLATAHAHPKDSFQVSAIVSSKPHLESPTYKELVDKYCFWKAV